jgi:outer membrane protein assembly factor BamB
MKKIGLAIFLSLCSCSCFLFRSRVAPYPTGVIFPVSQKQTISVESEVNDVLLRSEDRIYFTTAAGVVLAYAGTTPEPLWRFEMASPSQRSLIQGRGSFYAVDQENTVYNLNLEGEQLWKSSVPENITGAICEDEDQIYLGTETGRFFALNRATGEVRWDFEAGGAIHSTPVCVRGKVYFGCDDHTLYSLSPTGAPAGKFTAAGRIQGGLLTDGERLYFGADDYYIYCLELKDLKQRWKVKTGGIIASPPVADAKHIFVISRNNVLTCVYKKNGHIRWWKNLPARTLYRPEIVEDRIIVSTRSRKAICFETTTGALKGEYSASAALRSNPVWISPLVAVATQGVESGQGAIQFLSKLVSASLAPSKASPQLVNEEIVFTAHVSGFHLPRFEFTLTRHQLVRYGFAGIVWVRLGEEKQLVQEESEMNTWNWYPEEDGAYLIEVKVSDEKEQSEARLPFLVEKEPPKTIE